MQSDSPGVERYRDVLLERLCTAGIDISRLWIVVEGNPSQRSRLASSLNALVFQIPGELARMGYPREKIDAAGVIAKRMQETAFAEISLLTQELLGEPAPPATVLRDDPESPLSALG